MPQQNVLILSVLHMSYLQNPTIFPQVQVYV